MCKSLSTDDLVPDEALALLRQAGFLASARLGADATLEQLVNLALELTDGRQGTLQVVDRQGRRIVARAEARPPHPLPHASNNSAAALARLTPRERDVLELVVHGLPNKGIARALVISENTVKRYLKSIFAKLGVDSRTAAATLAVRAGMR